jgi:hypothetical protein
MDRDAIAQAYGGMINLTGDTSGPPQLPEADPLGIEKPSAPESTTWPGRTI